MNIAVVPAKNEQGRIGYVLNTLSNTLVEKIIVVVNGSTDNTMKEIKALKMKNLDILYFTPELGIDIPRAIGAYRAYKEGAMAVVFVDGDMIGDITSTVNELIFSIIHAKVDLAMTNCYPELSNKNELTEQILLFRTLLNLKLGIYEKIEVATPSHGPHAVSRRLLQIINFKYLALPPLVLAFAVKHNLNIDIPVKIPHSMLGSKIRSPFHAKKIADTIIGDTIEAINYFTNRPKTRCYLYKDYQGYNPFRRFDLLQKYIEKN